MSELLNYEIGRQTVRLAEFLAGSAVAKEAAVAQSLAFLSGLSQCVHAEAPTPQPDQPFDRLISALNLSELEVRILVLAGMPEEHEGLSAIFRTLHPRGEPRPSVGLTAQLFCDDEFRRPDLRRMLEGSSLGAYGVVVLTGDVPFFEQPLELARGLWAVLRGGDRWPAPLTLSTKSTHTCGLEEWFASKRVARAVRAVSVREACTVLVSADSDDIAFRRGLALVAAAGRRPAGIRVEDSSDQNVKGLVQSHALARDVVPVLELPAAEGPKLTIAPDFAGFPGPVVVTCRTGAASVRSERPLLAVTSDTITPVARKRIWRHVLPELNGNLASRVSRFAVEPSTAAEIAGDLRCKSKLDGAKPSLEDVSESLRARAMVSLSSGLKLVRPAAQWSDLVLSRDRKLLLGDAIQRLDLQSRVLDDWGFLKGRPGARGVRMLFSGPPGTGKTFAAEIIAKELAVDLLVVDISRVVSKWIGETEKNLAAVFEAAEQAQAVLFFDEADALFGKRTEVSDAHDRYANLETAYLLARLERFEGLAILATNLRQNIDTAFLRRLEFVVDFDEPDREERFQIWNRHIPEEGLLDGDVNLYEFAAHYPVVGGFIRNAAVAAAYLAASDGGRISRGHLVRAVRREYEKAGRAFPGLLPGVKSY